MISTTPKRKKSVTLAEEVKNSLTQKIRQGTYPPGTKLPTEPLIMAEHGVSRTVVREAVSRLQAAGLVETRHGIGTFVLIPPLDTPLIDSTTVVTIRDVLSMLELRISLETEAAGLAAQRRTDEQLSRIRLAVNRFEESILRGDRAIDADFEFHLQIALATQNRYFEEVYRRLGTTTIPRTRLDTSRFSEETAPNYLHRAHREHEQILDAIARKDSDTARACMRMHLSNSRERLRKAIAAAGLDSTAAIEELNAASHTTS